MSANKVSKVSGALALVAAAVAIASYFGSSRPDPNARPKSSEEVQNRVMSPFCPGVLLTDCPTEEAIRLRDRIKEKVELGWTNGQIDAWLVESYNEKVLAAPRGPEVWLIPSAWVLAGGALVTFVSLRAARRQSKQRFGESSKPAPTIAATDRARIESELRAFEKGTTE